MDKQLHASPVARTLLRRARARHNTIYPCAGKTRLEDCFTVCNNQCIFWFNTGDDSTHILSAPL